MKRNVVVTGMGVICNAGSNINEFFESIKNPPRSETCEKELTLFDDDLGVMGYQVDTDAIDIDINPKYRSRSNLLALKSLKECIGNYRKMGDETNLGAIIIGSSTGGQYEGEQFILDMINRKSVKNENINYMTNCAISSVADCVADYLNFDGELVTISTACTSSSNSLIMGAMMIEQGVHDCVLIGGVDSLCYTTLLGFKSLRLTGKNISTPFGNNRKGMVVGEGAGFLILESKDKVTEENRNYYSEIYGYAMSSDAYQMTSPLENGESAYEVMELALKKAKMSPRDIDFVNAHGVHFPTYTFDITWNRNTLNRGMLPTSGNLQTFSLNLSGKFNYDWFKASYKIRQFWELADNWSIVYKGQFGYGRAFNKKGNLPIFARYYAGGINSVRGYAMGSLGDAITRASGADAGKKVNDTLGGNILFESSIALIFPMPFVKDHTRIQPSIFFDAGSTFNENSFVTKEAWQNVGYSVGLGVTWITPFAPITFSVSFCSIIKSC